MKKILIVLIFCWASVASAQLPPEFEMPIWFEDAVGNKDTIWVGGDLNASSSQLNPHLGEVELLTPFDSTFEVRAIHGFDNQWRMSKKIIEGTDNPSEPCFLPAHTRIMVYAKHLPVKISWDTAQLAPNYPCNINTLLTPDALAFLLPHWTEARVLFCMMTRTEIYDDFDYSEFPSPPWAGTDDFLVHEFEVEGQGLKELPGLYYTGFWESVPYCYTTLPNNDLEQENGIGVYPNPSSDLVYIRSEERIERVQLFDAFGRLILNQNGSDSSVSLKNIHTGVYQMMVTFQNGKTTVKKIVKN